MSPDLQFECAWCRAEGRIPVPLDRGLASHGICPRCVQRHFPEYWEELLEVLEGEGTCPPELARWYRHEDLAAT